MSRIFLTGDVHGGEKKGFSKLSSKKFTVQSKLNKKDLIIILGDFGVPWSTYVSKTDKYWIKWFDSKSWTTLVVPGNHDNYNYLESAPLVNMFGGQVRQISNSIFYFERGQVFTINKKKFLVLGGGDSLDKDVRIADLSWWEREVPSVSEMNNTIDMLDSIHNNKVDYVLSHVSPSVVLKSYFKYLPKDPTVDFLDYIIETVEYRRMYSAHVHKDCYFPSINCQVLYQEIVELF